MLKVTGFKSTGVRKAQSTSDCNSVMEKEGCCGQTRKTGSRD